LSPGLVLFDLDHTLLDGDSDQLWCDFLIDQGLLDAETFGSRNAEMERGYRDGTVSVQDFCDFYVGTLAGRTAAQWHPLRESFLHERVVPRLHAGAAALVQRHRLRGELLVLTTATNRFITELTAGYLGLPNLIATECETDAAGHFTGATLGPPNMREGKVTRLHAWLAERGLALGTLHSCFYSDSANDLPLLEAVDEPVVTHPDQRLAAVAAARGWPVISLRQTGP